MYSNGNLLVNSHVGKVSRHKVPVQMPSLRVVSKKELRYATPSTIAASTTCPLSCIRGSLHHSHSNSQVTHLQTVFVQEVPLRSPRCRPGFRLQSLPTTTQGVDRLMQKAAGQTVCTRLIGGTGLVLLLPSIYEKKYS